jgi:molecular chaperone DnaK
MKQDKAAGIDLGTTNSVIGVLDIFDKNIYLGRHEGPRGWGALLPSAVAWVPGPEPGGGRIVVGWQARARLGQSEPPVLSVKRKMGSGRPVLLAGREVTPAHVSSLILKAAVAELGAVLAESQPDIQVRRLVITVPARFKDLELQDTRRAGEEAGLEVVELLPEPVAAAIHFCWKRGRLAIHDGRQAPLSRQETFLVLDLGGGTYDVSLILRTPNAQTGDEFQTLGTDGDIYLGGDDFDKVLAEDLLRRLAEEPGCRISSTNPAHASNQLRFALLVALAEEIKIKLSKDDRVEVDRPGLITDDNGRRVAVRTTYTRRQFDDLIRPKVAQTLPKIDRALEEAGRDITQVDAIVMVGGSSYVPLVQEMVTEHCCRGQRRARCDGPELHSPDLCVGMGAALKAASLGRIMRPESGPAVLFDGYGTSAQRTTAVPVEVLDPGVKLPADGAELATPTGSAIRGRVVGPTRALFADVPLAENQVSQFSLRLRAAAGREPVRIDFALRHDPRFMQPLSVNASVTVLSYRLSLDVRDPDTRQVYRHELAPKLTALPNEFTHRLAFPGNTETLEFRVYGDEQHIKTFHVRVPRGLPQGSPIDLKVAIDGSHKVRCRGVLPDTPGAEPFEFSVEPPPAEEVPTAQEVGLLAARVDSTLKQYRGHDGPQRAMEVMRLLNEVERALEQRDHARLIQRVRELRALLDQLDPSRLRVEPPLEKMRELRSECLRYIDELPLDSTLRKDEQKANVEANAQEAEEAAARVPPDGELYAKCVGNLRSAHATLWRELMRLEIGRRKKLSPSDQARESIYGANSRYEELIGQVADESDRAKLAEARAKIDRAEQYQPTDPEKAIREAEAAARLMAEVQVKFVPPPPPPGGTTPPEKDGSSIPLGTRHGTR